MESGRDIAGPVPEQPGVNLTASERLETGEVILKNRQASVRHLPEDPDQRRGAPWLLCGQAKQRHGMFIIPYVEYPLCKQCERKAGLLGLDMTTGVKK